MRYIHLSHTRSCLCDSFTLAPAARVVIQGIGSPPYRYLTTRIILTQFLRSTRGVESALLANRRDRYRRDDWSSDHPTKFSDRLTQLAGVYRHAYSTSGHVIKFMAIFKNCTRYISLSSHRNKHKLTYFREVTSTTNQHVQVGKLKQFTYLQSLSIYFFSILSPRRLNQTVIVFICFTDHRVSINSTYCISIDVNSR